MSPARGTENRPWRSEADATLFADLGLRVGVSVRLALGFDDSLVDAAAQIPSEHREAGVNVLPRQASLLDPFWQQAAQFSLTLLVESVECLPHESRDSINC
jgi:hypothetical protein